MHKRWVTCLCSCMSFISIFCILSDCVVTVHSDGMFHVYVSAETCISICCMLSYCLVIEYSAFGWVVPRLCICVFMFHLVKIYEHCRQEPLPALWESTPMASMTCFTRGTPASSCRRRTSSPTYTSSWEVSYSHFMFKILSLMDNIICNYC